MNQNLMEVRAALLTSSNTTGGDSRSGVGGVEIQKRIEELPIEAFNNLTDLARLLERKNISQLAYIWNLVAETAAGSGIANSSFLFYSEGASGTPQSSTQVQLLAASKAWRTDYEVSGLMIAAGMGNQLANQAKYAAQALAVGEEKAIISGSDTSAYGFSGSFLGLLQLMNSYTDLGDTTSIYGIARASGKPYLDVQVVKGAASAADALSLADLDAAITASNKRGAKGHRRIFFSSEDRLDEIQQLLQPQRRFVGDSVEHDGGFRIPTYQRIPLVSSRFMDKNGITYNGSSFSASAADQAMYLLDLDHMSMVHVAGVNAVHTPVVGSHTAGGASLTGADVVGGFFKSYGVLVMDRLDSQVLICNLNDI